MSLASLIYGFSPLLLSPGALLTQAFSVNWRVLNGKGLLAGIDTCLLRRMLRWAAASTRNSEYLHIRS